MECRVGDTPLSVCLIEYRRRQGVVQVADTKLTAPNLCSLPTYVSSLLAQRRYCTEYGVTKLVRSVGVHIRS